MNIANVLNVLNFLISLTSVYSKRNNFLILLNATEVFLYYDFFISEILKSKSKLIFFIPYKWRVIKEI